MKSGASYQDITGLGDVALEAVTARARRIELLDAIDRVSHGLRKDREVFHWLTVKFQEGLDRLAKGEQTNGSKEVLDQAEDVWLEIQARAKSVYERLITWRTSAQKDDELEQEEREDLVEEFTQTIAAIAELHNSVNRFRWVVAESDCNACGEDSGPFNSVEELLTSIKA